ncbi:MAG: T9SS type A sorting domain-containing protein [Flavobacteriia bacterium]|nr:T9SS type A sorting domain-containing protein [Flavobacteriia bacterium]OJX37698.1 MAG: hypothetical protein BGO87_11585 [Flavobacteriia bacterium 40-80]
MRYLIIILLSLTVKLPAFSQGAFHLKHIVPYTNEIFGVAECKEGYLLVGVNSQQNGIYNGYMLFLSRNGDIMWEKKIPEYVPDNYERYRSVMYYAGYFYIGGTVRINNKDFCLLVKVDIQGNISYKKIFGAAGSLAYDNYLRSLLVNRDGILVASAGFNGNGTKGELMQIDFEGNILWSKFFSYDLASNNYWEYFEDMKKGKDGNFILTLSSNANNIDFTYNSIIKVNPDGEELWRKTFNTLKPSALTEDSIYLMAAAPFKENHVLAYFVVNTVPQYVVSQTDFALIEYDEQGNEIDYKRFYNPNGFGGSNIYTNQNDEIFISGARNYVDSTMLGVIKFNMNKEIKWNKYYYKENSSAVDPAWPPTGETFYCGMPASDNGFILSGIDFYMISNNYYWNSTIIKTDCEGNTVWDYSRCVSPEFGDITIFPNPSSDNFIIQLPDLQEKDKIQIAVYDIMGKLVQVSEYLSKDVITVNSSAWAEGTYICRIAVNNEVVKTEKLLKIDGM